MHYVVLGVYVYASEEASLSIASGAALIGYLWNNSKPMRPNGLVNKVNKDERKGSSLLAMQDAIDDACKFSWNRRDAEYKNFRYALDTSKPRGRKLRKCFS